MKLFIGVHMCPHSQGVSSCGAYFGGRVRRGRGEVEAAAERGGGENVKKTSQHDTSVPPTPSLGARVW